MLRKAERLKDRSKRASLIFCVPILFESLYAVTIAFENYFRLR